MDDEHMLNFFLGIIVGIAGTIIIACLCASKVS